MWRRAFIFPIQFQHTDFGCLFDGWRSLFILVVNFFVVSPCLQVSATVRLFLPGWVDLKKKRRNYVSRGNFGMDATPKAIKVLQFLSHGKIQKLNIASRYFRTCFFSLYIFWQIMKNHVFCYSFSCVTDCETRLCHLINLFIRYTMYHFLYWK